MCRVAVRVDICARRACMRTYTIRIRYDTFAHRTFRHTRQYYTCTCTRLRSHHAYAHIHRHTNEPNTETGYVSTIAPASNNNYNIAHIVQYSVQCMVYVCARSSVSMCVCVCIALMNLVLFSLCIRFSRRLNISQDGFDIFLLLKSVYINFLFISIDS